MNFHPLPWAFIRETTVSESSRSSECPHVSHVSWFTLVINSIPRFHVSPFRLSPVSIGYHLLQWVELILTSEVPGTSEVLTCTPPTPPEGVRLVTPSGRKGSLSCRLTCGRVTPGVAFAVRKGYVSCRLLPSYPQGCQQGWQPPSVPPGFPLSMAPDIPAGDSWPHTPHGRPSLSRATP